MKQKALARVVSVAAALALALAACSASPPELLTADGVERASVDREWAYPAETGHVPGFRLEAGGRPPGQAA